MVEETVAPERNVPIAMAITLFVTTLLYVTIAAIAVTVLPTELLATRPAPLSLWFQQVAGIGATSITVITIVATLNTIIAQWRSA